jgi:predicted CXXCH cytochrome family protein
MIGTGKGRRASRLLALLLFPAALILTGTRPGYSATEVTPGRCAAAGCHDSLLTAGEVHQPVAEEMCIACHNPHGAPQAALLVKAYPPELYTRYKTDKYDLCWECHDSALAADKFTATATGFRRGKRNFHYSHLHKGKGITCRACHSPHASGQAFIIRSDGPPGVMSWNGRQAFQPLPDGGRCSGGCHTDVSYRR